MWHGLVYAMIVIALQSFEAAGEEPQGCRGRLGPMLREYRRLAARSVRLGDLDRPRPFIIEAGLLHIIGKLGRNRDIGIGMLSEVSLIVRLSIVMGYHCEPRLFPDFSPFMGEMRRRVWCAVHHVDLLISSWLGLQPIIRPESTNIELPSNLYEDELHENIEALPPSRPMSTPTPMCYIICKSKLLSVFGQVWEGTQLAANDSFGAAMELDKKLHDTHTGIPSYFKMRPIEESLRDPAEVVMQRYALDLLFLRTQCILHRRFMSLSKSDFSDGYSRRTVINASMMILKHQATLHRESAPGGRLRSIKWLNMTLVTQDFILGAMNVCLTLYAIDRAEQMGRRAPINVSGMVEEEKSRMRAALEQSRDIWASLREDSIDAFKAHGMLTAMLNFLQKSRTKGKERYHVQQEASVAENCSGNKWEDCRTLPEQGRSKEVPYYTVVSDSAAEPFTSYDTAWSTPFPQHQPINPTMTSILPDSMGASQSFLPVTGNDWSHGTINISNSLDMFSPSLAFPNVDMPDADIDLVSCCQNLRP